MTPAALQQLVRDGRRLVASEFHAPRMERFTEIALLLPNFLEAIEYLQHELHDAERRALASHGTLGGTVPGADCDKVPQLLERGCATHLTLKPRD